MKKTVIALVILVLALPLYAGPYNDVSLSFGMDNYKWPMDGISFSYGVNIGITDRLELGAWGISELIDIPFSENVFGLEASYALIGKRNTGSIVAGSGINTLVGAGLFYSTKDKGIGPMITITPITIGSSISGRREKVLKTNAGWDAVNGKLFISCSLITIDIFVKGTYKDYEY